MRIGRSLISIFMAGTTVLYMPASFAATISDPVQQIFITDSAMVQSHEFDRTDSVWIDGDWHVKNGSFGTRYVDTFVFQENLVPAIQFMGQYEPHIIKCPRKIGHIGITSIGSSHGTPWYTVHFTSTSGVTGTVNLLTRRWTFNNPKARIAFSSIDPIKRLRMDTWIRPPGETSLWIDGDWHTHNGFGQRYVSSFVGPHSSQGWIQVQDNNGGELIPGWGTRGPAVYKFPVPHNVKSFTITTISDQGNVLHMRDTSGITGTFNLSSHQWNIEAAQSSLLLTSRAQASTRTYTFGVPDSLRIPSVMQRDIMSYSSIPVSLPTSLKLDSPLPPNWQLAIDMDVSQKEYGLDIFERPKGSDTNKYDMATLIGDMETVINLNSIAIPYDFDVGRFTSHRALKLVDYTSATDYRNPKSFDHAIIWSGKHWKYIAEGQGSGYESKTLEMADAVATFVAKNGLPVSHATRGYLQALWMGGNQPEFAVTWTYSGKQWYFLSMDTLMDTLKTASTVSLYR